MKLLFISIGILVLTGCVSTPTVEVQSVQCPTKVVIDESVLELLSTAKGNDDFESLWCSLASAKVSDRTLDFIKYDNGGVPITLHQYVKDWQKDDSLEKYSVAEICKRIAKAKSLEAMFQLIAESK